MCSCVCPACVRFWDFSVHICVPAVHNQISIFPRWALSLRLASLSLSLSIRICFKHLVGDFTESGISLFKFWLCFVPLPILMNRRRQHTLLSVINAHIYSLLFIRGGVWSFATAERTNPQPLGILSSKLVSSPWRLTHANWTHLTRLLSTKPLHLFPTVVSPHPIRCICIRMEDPNFKAVVHRNRDHSSSRLLICLVFLSHLIFTLGLILCDKMPTNICMWLHEASPALP